MSTSAKRSGSWWPWPGLIVVLLMVNVAGTGALIYAAHRDGTPASEPEFYQRGIEADRRAAERAKSDQLGWTVSTTIRDGLLRVEITDAHGLPVRADTASAEVIRRSESGQWEQVLLHAGADDVCAGRLGRAERGSYEVRLAVTRGKDRLVRTAIVLAEVSP